MQESYRVSQTSQSLEERIKIPCRGYNFGLGCHLLDFDLEYASSSTSCHCRRSNYQHGCACYDSVLSGIQ